MAADSSTGQSTTGGIVIYSVGGINMSAAVSPAPQAPATGNIHVEGTGYINLEAGNPTSQTPGTNDINLNAQGNVNVYGQNFNNHTSGNQNNSINANQVNKIWGQLSTIVGGSNLNITFGNFTQFSLGV
jgi:hypothetical protein